MTTSRGADEVAAALHLGRRGEPAARRDRRSERPRREGGHDPRRRVPRVDGDDVALAHSRRVRASANRQAAPWRSEYVRRAGGRQNERRRSVEAHPVGEHLGDRDDRTAGLDRLIAHVLATTSASGSRGCPGPPTAPVAARAPSRRGCSAAAPSFRPRSSPNGCARSCTSCRRPTDRLLVGLGIHPLQVEGEVLERLRVLTVVELEDRSLLTSRTSRAPLGVDALPRPPVMRSGTERIRHALTQMRVLDVAVVLHQRVDRASDGHARRGGTLTAARAPLERQQAAGLPPAVPDRPEPVLVGDNASSKNTSLKNCSPVICLRGARRCPAGSCRSRTC